MRIQHNIMAMNSYRNFSNNTKAVGKNLEKLSSGYRINNAGDDAAGLAVSEKMRAQITGLKTAQKNAKDGISLVKTAEGALTEVHSMLNRMVDLAGQSANGTYDNEVDRKNLQKEVSALKDEINRIADSTNFNGIKLLDGSMGGGDTKVSPNVSFKIANATDAMAAGVAKTDPTNHNSVAGSAVGAGTASTAGTYAIEYTDIDGSTKTMNVGYTQSATADAATHGADITAALNADSKFSALFEASDDGAGVVSIKSKDAGSTAPKATKMGITTAAALAAGSTTGADASTTVKGTFANGDSVTINGKTYTKGAAADADKGVFSTDAELISQLKTDGYAATGTLAAGLTVAADPSAKAKGLRLQIGDTAESHNQMVVSVGSMHVASLGIDSVNISTQEGAAAAMDSIKNAINTVSGTRGDLGALQNRLDHTINNLSVMHENIQDAEATIRDTDVADEMMAYTKNNILVQSAQAMLAQANQVPQGVLQLLG